MATLPVSPPVRRKRSEVLRVVEGARKPRLPALLEACAITGFEASRRVASEPIAWVWRGIIARTHAVEVCGQTASGKSTFTTLFAVAVANPTGKPLALLGRDVTPAPDGQLVLIVNEENSRQSAVASVDRAIALLGLPERETWERIVLLSRANVVAHWIGADDDEPEDGQAITKADAIRLRLENPTTAWEAVIAAAQAGAWGLVVLDTRAKILRLGETNSEDAQADASRLVTTLVEHARCPVVVVSHTRKGASGEDLDDVSGSAQRAGGADVILLASAERERGRVLATKIVVAKLRDGDGDEHPEPMRFALTKKGETWALILSEGESAEATKLPAHERVYKALDDAEGEMTSNEIRRALAMNHTTVRESLDVLRRSRRVKSRESKRNGAKCWLHQAVPTFEEVMGVGGPNDV